MGSLLTLKAPAKVNLYLELVGRRSDGYHEIISIFQMISLFDRLRFRSLRQENAFLLEGKFNFPESENIITQAVNLFREQTGDSTGIHIRVDKRIPVGAGLGGGSSDAAATLKGLNIVLETGFSQEKLQRLACTLGSDVPFFLSTPAALVTGRGEKIKALPLRCDFFLILVCPGFQISTKEAYSWFDDLKNKPGSIALRSKEEIERSYLKDSISQWNLFNSFQSVVEQRFPQIREATIRLKDLGANYSGISGSGSAVFGLFPDMNTAVSARNALTGDYPLVRIVKPLAKTLSTGLK